MKLSPKTPNQQFALVIIQNAVWHLLIGCGKYGRNPDMNDHHAANILNSLRIEVCQ